MMKSTPLADIALPALFDSQEPVFLTTGIAGEFGGVCAPAEIDGGTGDDTTEGENEDR